MERYYHLLLFICCLCSLSACKKDWTCHCIDNTNNSTYHVMEDMRIKNAVDKCKSYQYHDVVGFNNCTVVY